MAGDSVPEYVAERLQRMILAGELAPGEALPAQRTLAERLGVSRTSLREALTVLETLGLVRVRAGKGVFVSDPSADDTAPGPRGDRYTHAARVYQLRLAIEPFVSGLVAITAADAEIDRLAETVAEMRAALAEGDLVRAAQADGDFHQRLLVAAGNPLFPAAMRPAGPMLAETRRIPFANRESVRAPLDEHERILAQIRARSPQGARDAMHRHILSAASRADVGVLRP